MSKHEPQAIVYQPADALTAEEMVKIHIEIKSQVEKIAIEKAGEIIRAGLWDAYSHARSAAEKFTTNRSKDKEVLEEIEKAIRKLATASARLGQHVNLEFPPF